MATLGKRLLALGVGSILGLVVIEGVLHLSGTPRFYRSHSTPSQFAFPREDLGPVLVYTSAPSSPIPFEYDGDPRGYFGPSCTVEHRTNSAGFRGPEFSTDKPKGVLRLCFLGDSFTFGEGVRFEDTFAEQTARELGTRLPSVECYNFGVGGFNTTQQYELLRTGALETRPDVVVLVYVLNDAEPPLFWRDPATGGVARLDRGEHFPKGQPQAEPPMSPVYWLRSARLLWKRTQGKDRTQRTIDYYRSLFADDAQGWKASRKAIADAAALCRQQKVPCVVVAYPILVHLDDYPFLEIHAKIADATRQAGARFLDLYPSFEDQEATAMWVHPTDQHPNEIAHGIAARALSDFLLSENLLP